MGIIYFKYIQQKLSELIIDKKILKKINEYINFFIKNNAVITINSEIIILSCNHNQKNYNLKIIKTLNKLEYTYIEDNYKEMCKIYKTKTKYITKQEIIYQNQKKLKISIFNQEQEEIFKYTCNTNQLEHQQNIVTDTYIKTPNNIVFLIEKNQNKTTYYIGYYEEYEQYIPQHIIYSEIEYEEYNSFLKNNNMDIEILQKYFGKYQKLISNHWFTILYFFVIIIIMEDMVWN